MAYSIHIFTAKTIHSSPQWNNGEAPMLRFHVSITQRGKPENTSILNHIRRRT
ncbi:hypothetical protein [Stieleria maiorica]|uniref:hypothetical protein n=1 Tax=Stieleria maiorica TaxID=2795974 RepID=UPI00142F330A|nr:hypothetical protein [Stieleria maiorica]